MAMFATPLFGVGCNVTDTGRDEGESLDSVSSDVQPADATDSTNGADFDDVATSNPSCVGEIDGEPLPWTADDTFMRGPYLQSVGTESAYVIWRTAEPGIETGCVQYETASGSGEVCDDPDLKGQYEVRLDGLAPGSTVTYTASVGTDLEAGPFTFRTAPADPEPVRLLMFGDSHNNPEILRPLVEAGLDKGVDIAVGIGDLVNQPEEGLMDMFFDGLMPLGARVPFWPVLGNHEARGQAYFDAFVVPGAAPEPPEEIYYEVRWGNVWMGMLELVEFDISYWISGVETPEVAWLTERLASKEAQDARWRFLFIHQPPWCVGWGHCDKPQYHGEVALREVLMPIAKVGGVTAVFSGHMHGYEHGVMDGVHLFMTGGAGGALDHFCSEPEGLPQPWTKAYLYHWLQVDAGCDSLVVDALDLDGNLVDRVEIPFTG